MTDPESVADHSYSVVAMSMLFADVDGLNTCRIVKMAILHDLAESITGDLTPKDATVPQKNHLEDAAMKCILQDLPAEQRQEYRDIMTEYRRNETSEAQLLHQIDKLEMALQAGRYQRDEESSGDIRPFLDTADRTITSQPLRRVFNILLANNSLQEDGRRERQPDRVPKASDRNTL